MSTTELIWFRLLGPATEMNPSDSVPTSILRSSLVIPIVDRFRYVIKDLFSDSHLKGVAAIDLQVYENIKSFEKRSADQDRTEPLKSSHSMDGLGKSEDESVIVVIKRKNLSYMSVTDRLKQFKIEFSIKDLDYLSDNDWEKYSRLKSDDLTRTEAKAILSGAKAKIKSATRNAIGLRHSFYLDGLLNVTQGQTKSSLYYAFSETGGIFVAKVYLGHKEDFDREVRVSNSLEHRNLVKFITSFSLDSDNKHVIIMPFFPRSLADLLSPKFIIPFEMIKIVARNCFDALCHLHEKGFCFVDLKPANIMLHNTEPGYATLVDYGATVPIGDPVFEYTSHFCLDADIARATETLDWICLGTTLAHIEGFHVSNYERIADLVYDVSRSDKHEYLKRLLISCLEQPSSDKIEATLTH